MAERKRLECRNHGNCLWILEYMTSCDGHLPEWDGEHHDCAEYEPMPDVRALLDMGDEMFESATGLALISELEDDADLKDLQTTMAKVLFGYARRIREAIGEDAS